MLSFFFVLFLLLNPIRYSFFDIHLDAYKELSVNIVFSFSLHQLLVGVWP